MEKLIQQILEIPAESQNVEFKRLGGPNIVSKIIQTIVAMANTNGGIIILGVEDPEKTKKKGLDRILGIEENLGNYDSINAEIKRIVPPLTGIWPGEVLSPKGLQVKMVLLDIPKATESFHSVDNKVYIREQKSNRQLTAHELVPFAYAKGFTKVDRELVEVDLKLLNTDHFRLWGEARGITGSVPDALEKTGLARRSDKGVLLPTLAAVLLFAEYPSDITNAKCAIRIFQYTGNTETIGETPNLLGTPKTLQGPAVKLISDAHQYVLNLLRTGVRIPSGFQTQYQIPERAVKEAITNAVIHRDYHAKRDIEIKIFEDRLEIESAGLLPYNITKFNIGFERAMGYRNDLLVKHLREFPSPPNLDQNEGVKAMRAEMKARNLYFPIFMTFPDLKDSVKVILLNEQAPSEWEKLRAFLRINKYVNNELARKASGVVQRDKMTKLLKKWVRQGLLLQTMPYTGYRKGTLYQLPEVPDIREE